MANDPEVFEGVADIHSVSCERAAETLAGMLGMTQPGPPDEPEEEFVDEPAGEPAATEDGTPLAHEERKQEITVRQLADKLGLSYAATVQAIEQHGQFGVTPCQVYS